MAAKTSLRGDPREPLVPRAASDVAKGPAERRLRHEPHSHFVGDHDAPERRFRERRRERLDPRLDRAHGDVFQQKVGQPEGQTIDQHDVDAARAGRDQPCDGALEVARRLDRLERPGALGHMPIDSRAHLVIEGDRRGDEDAPLSTCLGKALRERTLARSCTAADQGESSAAHFAFSADHRATP